MKQVLQHLRSGEMEITELPCPQAEKGQILIRTRRNIISLGTDRTLMEFGQYLKSQCQYSSQTRARDQHDYLSWKDRIRRNAPVMIILVPMFSFFIRNGFLSGKAGAIYALNRLIAVSIHFRLVLAEKLRKRGNSK